MPGFRVWKQEGWGNWHLQPAAQSYLLVDSLWRDPAGQHWQLLLPGVPQRLLCAHALRLADLSHPWGEGN